MLYITTKTSNDIGQSLRDEPDISRCCATDYFLSARPTLNSNDCVCLLPIFAKLPSLHETLCSLRRSKYHNQAFFPLFSMRRKTTFRSKENSGFLKTVLGFQTTYRDLLGNFVWISGGFYKSDVVSHFGRWWAHTHAHTFGAQHTNQFQYPARRCNTYSGAINWQLVSYKVYSVQV